jgi:hypothetical protein
MHSLHRSFPVILLLASAHAFARFPPPMRAMSTAVFPLRTPPPVLAADVALECAARSMCGEPWFLGNASGAPVLPVPNATGDPERQPPTSAVDHVFPSGAISLLDAAVPPRPFPGRRDEPQCETAVDTHTTAEDDDCFEGQPLAVATDVDVVRLQNELRTLHAAFCELCAAIVRSDDVVLLERDLFQRGTIASVSPSTDADREFVERMPVTLRSRVLELTNRHKIALPNEDDRT